MKIGFYLDNAKKETSPVRAIIRMNGQRYTLSVRESVISKFWNSDKCRCRVSRDNPNAKNINARLDEWEQIIKDALNSFGLVVPTPKMFKDKVSEIIKQMNIQAGGITENEEEQYLVAFAERLIENSTRSFHTKQGYETALKKLKQFEKVHKTKLRFIDIDINFNNKFRKWMLSTRTRRLKIPYAKNTIGQMFRCIIFFMNEAKRMKIHDFNGYKEKGFVSDREETDSVYLTNEEIAKIHNLEINKYLLEKHNLKTKKYRALIASLSEERDRFLLGCYTALRNSDYSRLENLHYDNDIIAVWTLKKDKKVYIPMHAKLKELLKRRNNILPSPVSNNHHNNRIKIICQLAGIDEEVTLKKTRGGIREETRVPKYQAVTSHTARRSGATNMYLAGIDIKFIQGILGHSKIEQTVKYIKVTAEENAKRLLDHPYFTG